MPRSSLALAFALALSLLITSEPALADGAIRETFPLAGLSVPNRCTGERVVMTSGVLNVVAHQTFDGAGGAHLSLHNNVIDATGVGTVTGSVYRWVESSQGTLNVGPGLSITFTDSVTRVLVTSGGAPNLVLVAIVHMTVDSNGDLVIFLSHISIDCPG